MTLRIAIKKYIAAHIRDVMGKENAIEELADVCRRMFENRDKQTIPGRPGTLTAMAWLFDELLSAEAARDSFMSTIESYDHLRHKATERLKVQLIDFRDHWATETHVREQLDAIISNLHCPNEEVDKCPDCGEPWWTVQKRCKCCPKPGTLERELADLEAQVATLYDMLDKPKVALSKLAKGQPPRNLDHQTHVNWAVVGTTFRVPFPTWMEAPDGYLLSRNDEEPAEQIDVGPGDLVRLITKEDEDA